MPKIYRFLGKSGRTTIPYPLRVAMNLKRYDLVSYELDGDTIIVRREKVCDNCASESGKTEPPGTDVPKPEKKQETVRSRARKMFKLKI